MTINEFMSYAVEFTFNLTLIGLMIYAMYGLAWVALFVPINKLRKHKEKAAIADRELKQIIYDIGTAEKAKSEKNEDLQKILWSIHYRKEEERKLNEQIALKQKLLASDHVKADADPDVKVEAEKPKKRGPGRPPKKAPKNDDQTEDNNQKKRGPGRPPKNPTN